MAKKKKKERRIPFCQQRGWKTLCARFRKFLNNETGPQGGLTYLEWTELRVLAARKFIEQEGLKKDKGDALINHVPICQMRGKRKCIACVEI